MRNNFPHFKLIGQQCFNIKDNFWFLLKSPLWCLKIDLKMLIYVVLTKGKTNTYHVCLFVAIKNVVLTIKGVFLIGELHLTK